MKKYDVYVMIYFRDTIIVCLGDFFTCIFAGFVIFAYLGFMAGKQSTTVEKVAQDGKSLQVISHIMKNTVLKQSKRLNGDLKPEQENHKQDHDKPNQWENIWALYPLRKHAYSNILKILPPVKVFR